VIPQGRRQRAGLIASRVAAAAGAALVALAALAPDGRAAAQQAGAGAAETPRTARSAAPIDITGYWVSIITEDWRWRMMTPPKGDYASLPLTNEARRVADGWDLARDEASGNACKPFGVGNIMRMPGRLHITWADDNTLRLDFDAGTQTRLLHFDGSRTPPAKERTWQGYSVADWEVAGQQVELDRNGIPVGGRGRGRGGVPPRGGALRVVTTHMREGYLRKNGVPYSEDAVVTEYFDRVGPEPNGDVFLIVRTVVEDPKYLTMPFITSTNLKLEPNGSKWNPTPCRIDPPAVPGR